jgi:cation-transporting ATPase E
MPGSLSQLRSSGLTRDAVAERVARGQVNRVEPFTTRTVSRILRHNMLTVFNGVLTASVTALVVIGVYSDAVFLG